MKIAVTYDNGQVFQHFGHCEQFKVYTVQDKKVTETEIVGSNGSGHSARAELLNNIKVDVLICGGVGGCAVAALAEYGIELYAGVQGDADEAVARFIQGTLPKISDANCSHHHEHGHGEGHSCGHCH